MNNAPPRQRRPRLVRTEGLPNPTEYVLALNGEYREFAFDEERARLQRGRWREAFGVSAEHAVDLEIGTGNGYFFAHRSSQHPERCLLGLEIKYKPLIQSIRRALRDGAKNARIMRYDAACLEDVLSAGEVNHVFIHHPDPWPKKRDWKHRLIQEDFLKRLHTLMQPGSFLDFKTDSADYFDWCEPLFRDSDFEIERSTRDLHASPFAAENFITHFERLFLQQGVKIHHARLRRK